MSLIFPLHIFDRHSNTALDSMLLAMLRRSIDVCAARPQRVTYAGNAQNLAEIRKHNLMQRGLLLMFPSLRPCHRRSRVGSEVLRRSGYFVLAILVAWHYLYVPVHLIAHEHYNSFSLFAVEHQDSTSHDSEDDHSAHAASDHLAGLWSVYDSAPPPVVFIPLALVTEELAVHAPARAGVRPRERSPPGDLG